MMMYWLLLWASTAEIFILHTVTDWTEIQQDYDEISMHNQFISFSKNENNLTFENKIIE